MVACVWAPGLPVQVERQRRGLGPGAILIEHSVERGTVYACSDDAAQAGVQPGQSLHQARTLAPRALVVAPEELAYHGAHAAIELALRTFSPALETVALGEWLVDVRGLQPHFASEAALAEALQAAAQTASGLSVRVGLAAGKFTAQQAARATAGVCVVAAGEAGRFLAPLSVAVLPNLPGEARRRLALFDLHTLGDLAALRKPAVLRQFGAEFAALYELARGHDPRPLQLDAPPLRVVRSLALPAGVRARGILLNVAGRLSRQVSGALAAQGHHAEALKVTLRLETGHHVEAGQACKPPTSDAARLTRLAGQLLGRLTVDAPVVNVAVSVYPLRAWHLGLHQRALVAAGVSARQTQLEDALRRVAHRFGEAVVRLAALLGPPAPLPVRVTFSAAGLPARYTLGGRTQVVVAIDEHWREERQWWRALSGGPPLRRDYFRVQLADGACRKLFQDLNTQAWYLDRAWPL